MSSPKCGVGKAGPVKGSQVVAGGLNAGPSLKLASPISEAPPPRLDSSENT